MAAETTSPPPALTGWRLTTDRAYVYVLTLFSVGVLVQFFFAGVGVFGDHAAKIRNASSFDLHRSLGDVLGVISFVVLILAIAARYSRTTWIGALVLAVLTIVAQSALAGGGEDNKWVGGLHALDGVIIMVLAGTLTGAGHRREKLRRGT